MYCGILNIAPFVRDRRQDCILLLMIFIADDGRPQRCAQNYRVRRIFFTQVVRRRIMKKKLWKGRCGHCHFGTGRSHVGVSKINEDKLNLLWRSTGIAWDAKGAILRKQCVICILQKSEAPGSASFCSAHRRLMLMVQNVNYVMVYFFAGMRHPFVLWTSLL